MVRMHFASFKYSRRKQSGVVLIIALVFLVALTAVAAALMQNTTTDIKMAGASQEKAIVMQETMSEMERVLFNERRRVNNGVNVFTSISQPQVLIATKPSITQATATPANPNNLDVPCPREARGTSSGIIMCRNVRVQVIRTYGRDNNQSIEVHSGVMQAFLGGN